MRTELCFVRDTHGGLVNMSEVLRINIRKLTSPNQVPETHYGVAVRQQGADDWVVMQTGTYEECKGVLDRISDAVSAYDSLESLFSSDFIPTEPGDIYYPPQPAPDDGAEEEHTSYDDDAADEEPVLHDDVAEEHDEPAAEEHDEPVEESDDEEPEEPVQELLLDED